MMSRRLRVAPKQAAELVSRVGKAMGGFVSAGELADISAQLPPDLRPLFQGDLTVFTNGRRGRR